jgi:hypothetical protein
MALPIIPILCGLGIIGGIAALVWYNQLSQERQDRANQLALSWFKRRFSELAAHQQEQIRKQMS